MVLSIIEKIMLKRGKFTGFFPVLTFALCFFHLHAFPLRFNEINSMSNDPNDVDEFIEVEFVDYCTLARINKQNNFTRGPLLDNIMIIIVDCDFHNRMAVSYAYRIIGHYMRVNESLFTVGSKVNLHSDADLRDGWVNFQLLFIEVQFFNGSKRSNFIPDGRNQAHMILLLNLNLLSENETDILLDEIQNNLWLTPDSISLLQYSMLDKVVYSQLILSTCGCFTGFKTLESKMKLTDIGHVNETLDFTISRCASYAQKQLMGEQSQFVTDKPSPGLPNTCHGFYYPTQLQLQELSEFAVDDNFYKGDEVIISQLRPQNSRSSHFTEWCTSCLPPASYVNITIDLLLDGRRQAFERRHIEFPERMVAPPYSSFSEQLYEGCTTINELRAKFARAAVTYGDVLSELQKKAENKPVSTLTPEEIKDFHQIVTKLVEQNSEDRLDKGVAAAAGAAIGAAGGIALNAGTAAATVGMGKLTFAAMIGQAAIGAFSDVLDILEDVSDLVDDSSPCPDCPDCPDVPTTTCASPPSSTTDAHKRRTHTRKITTTTNTSPTTSQNITTSAVEETTTTPPENETNQKSGDDTDHQCFLTMSEYQDQIKNVIKPLDSCDDNKSTFIRLSDLLEPHDRESSRDSYGTCNQLDLVFSRVLGRYIDCDDLSDIESEIQDLRICPKHLAQFGLEFTKWETFFQRKRVHGKLSYRCSIKDLPGHDVSVVARRFLDKDQAAVISQKFPEKHFLLGVPVCSRHISLFKDWMLESRVSQMNYYIAPANEEPLTFKPPITKQSSSPEKYCSSQSTQCSSQDTELTDSLPDSLSSSGSAGYQPPRKRVKELTEAETQQMEIQTGFRSLATNLGVSYFHCTKSFATLDNKEKSRRALAAKTFIHKMYSVCMAEDAPSELDKLVSKKMMQIYDGENYPKEFDQLATKITDLRDRCKNRRDRRALLALLTSVTPYSVAERYVPGLTKKEFTASRAWGSLYTGEQTLSHREKIHRHRVHTDQLKYLINFMCDPMILTELPFGKTKIKYSTGEVEEIPNTVRSINNKRFYQLYVMYMKEHDLEEQLLSESTVVKALTCCSAKQGKIEAGLDYITAAGQEAYDQLESVLSEINEQGLTKTNEVKELTTAANRCRSYYAGEYTLKLKEQSRISDHNLLYALSDPKKPAFSAFESDTDFSKIIDLSCDMCEMCKSTEHRIRQIVTEVKPNDAIDKQEWLWLTNAAITNINSWKAHQLRTVWSHKVVKDVMNNMKETDVFCVMDYAMKMLPVAYRESQRFWYAKRGMSWHLTYCSKRTHNGKDDFVRHVYVHLLSSEKQNQAAIIAILNHTIGEIKQQQPSVNQMYLASDNAGCYHGSEVIAALPLLSDNHHGIKIASYLFSEPQSGKGPCDRSAATLKQKFTNYLVETQSSILSSSDMLKALKKEGRIKLATGPLGLSISAYVGSVEILGPPNPSKPSIPSITTLGGFSLLEEGIRSYRHFGIGSGHLIETRHYVGKAYCANIVVSEQWSTDSIWTALGHRKRNKVPQTSEADLDNAEEDDDENEDLEQEMKRLGGMYMCPVESCSKTFRKLGNMERHLLRGDHKMAIEDQLINMFKGRLEHVHKSNFAVVNRALENTVQDRSFEPLQQGWALKTRAPQTTMNANQEDFLIDKFNEGQAGNKQKPEAVAKSMRRAKNRNQHPRFTPEEYMKPSQIKQFFSKLAAVTTKGQPYKKKGTVEIENEVDGSDDIICTDEMSAEDGTDLESVLEEILLTEEAGLID